MNNSNEYPSVGSTWLHSSGRKYTVLCIANEHSTDYVFYPPTVVYVGKDGKVWSRPYHDWHRSMTAI